MNSENNNQAFTLLEMLLVIAIIAILAGIVIVAINPGRQLAQARNAQRASDLRAIYSAVQQYYIDNKAWPTGLDGTVQDVCKYGVTDISCINLDVLVPDYVSNIPTDPLDNSPTSTDYQIVLNTSINNIGLTAVKSSEYELDTFSIGLNEDDAEWVAFVAETNDIMEAIEEYVADHGGDYMSLVQEEGWEGYYVGDTEIVNMNLSYIYKYSLDWGGYLDFNPEYGRGVVNIFSDVNGDIVANNLTISINSGDYAGCSIGSSPYVINLYNQSDSFNNITRSPFVQSTAFGFSGSWCINP